jgi:hypothetical protein
MGGARKPRQSCSGRWVPWRRRPAPVGLVSITGGRSDKFPINSESCVGQMVTGSRSSVATDPGARRLAHDVPLRPFALATEIVGRS